METPIYFCYSLYGHKDLYWRGLLENVKLIQQHFNNAKVLVIYENIPSNVFTELLRCKNILMWKNSPNTIPCVMQRVLILDHFSRGTFFIRDADSRVNERDIACIHDFLQSSKLYHIVRDHCYHKSKIMCGMFGIKKDLSTLPTLHSLFQEWQKAAHSSYEYGFDEKFLNDVIYPRIRDKSLIQTNSVGYADETILPIRTSLSVEHTFIGNAYDWTESGFTPRFRYWEFITLNHLRWLESQGRHNILVSIAEELQITQFSWFQRADILRLLFEACLKEKALEQASQVMANYRFALIEDSIIRLSNTLLQLHRPTRHIIASFDPERRAAANEIVIVYGEYGHDIRYLPIISENTGCVLYRHPVYFNDIVHDTVEYDSVWEPIDQIYILNLEERRDRYMHQLVELCRIQAPLHRIHHYKAQKAVFIGDRQRDAYIGATKNHYDVVANFIRHNFNICLVLEDDFLFNMNYTQIKKQLRAFFERNYTYDICFLGYSKYGELRGYDDLLSQSYQSCTTSSAYFLQKGSAHKILECLKTGVDKMIAGQDPCIYCCDRYWTKLQSDGHFFVFRDKLGYQRITHSDIVARVNYNFD